MSLWKKRGSTEAEPTAGVGGAQSSAERPELRSSTAEQRPPSGERRAGLERGGSKVANIGRSISIKGDVIGDEDLVIEGRVEGRVELKSHQLTVGASGDVTGEVHARGLSVLGRLTGNAFAAERVEVGGSGRLQGDIESPRLILQEGAQVNGKVTMKPAQPASTAAASGSQGPGSARKNEKPELPRSGPAVAQGPAAGSAPTSAPR